jgi:hypothetical protein
MREFSKQQREFHSGKEGARPLKRHEPENHVVRRPYWTAKSERWNKSLQESKSRQQE